MNQKIIEWLEQRTGDTRRQMALNLGHVPSTFNRNIETAEVIVAVCRHYGVNPVEGLVAGGIVTSEEVTDLSVALGLRTISEKSLLEEMLRRVAVKDYEHMDQGIVLGADGLPDYSKMSDLDAKTYELAAGREDENIGDDHLPSTP